MIKKNIITIFVIDRDNEISVKQPVNVEELENELSRTDLTFADIFNYLKRKNNSLKKIPQNNELIIYYLRGEKNEFIKIHDKIRDFLIHDRFWIEFQPRPVTAPPRPVTAPPRPVTAPPRPVTAPPRPVTAPPRPVTVPPRPVTAPPRPVTAPPRPTQEPLEPGSNDEFNVFIAKILPAFAIIFGLLGFLLPEPVGKIWFVLGFIGVLIYVGTETGKTSIFLLGLIILALIANYLYNNSSISINIFGGVLFSIIFVYLFAKPLFEYQEGDINLVKPIWAFAAILIILFAAVYWNSNTLNPIKPDTATLLGKDTNVPELYKEETQIIAPSPKRLNVVTYVFNNNLAAAALAGLKETGYGQAFENGYYQLIDVQGDKYVALNGKVDKLVRLLFEHGIEKSEKKSLTVGEKWDIGEGWTLTAPSIDAKATPRQVWLVLSKDGVTKVNKVIAQKQIITYVEESIAGESEVPLFVTFVDSIFAGATSDMVQLRFTWVVKPSVEIIQQGDNLGDFEVVNIDSMKNRLEVKKINKNTFSQNNALISRNNIVELISPLNNYVIDNGRSDGLDYRIWDFDWTDINGATYYQLYVIADNIPNPAIDTVVPISYYQIIDKGYAVSRSDWTWKVRAQVNGQWEEWSEIRKFRVEDVNTDPITLPYVSSTPTATQDKSTDTYVSKEPNTVVTPIKNLLYSKVLNYKFTKTNIVINAGDEVLWDNYDESTLTIVELDKKIPDITLKYFGKTKYVFDKVGNYRFGLFYNSKQMSQSIQYIQVN